MNSQLKQKNLLSFILGNESTILQTSKQNNEQTGKINKKLIMSSAMFWDSKKRIEKIKTLFLTGISLKQFDDTQDFQVQQLSSIQLLSLSKNNIIHLQPLSQLTTLVSLNISHNKVYDLNPLSSLINLSELYASNNDIKSIQPIAPLVNLKTLQVYKNKISIQHQQSTFKTLLALSSKLEELDIEENPICDQDFSELILSTLLNLKKFNGNLNKTSQKIKQMSSSKGFNSSKAFKSTSSMMFNNTKMEQSFVALGDAQSTLYNFNKKKDVKHSKIMEKQKILKKLEDHYTQLDEQFQQQIIKNVKNKNRLHKLMEQKSKIESAKQQNEFQKEEIKNLKRKVKAMKQNLFTKDKKGELLRKIFQIQTTYIKAEPKKQNTFANLENETTVRKLWTRKFQADEVIIIKNNNSVSKVSQQVEMNQALNQFDNTLADLKNQLEYLS